MDSEYNKTSRPFKHLYSTSKWKKLRLQFLHEYPLCLECKSKGVIKVATVVDHVTATRVMNYYSGTRAVGKHCARSAMIEGPLLKRYLRQIKGRLKR